jgi:hypothetical protein
LEVNSFFELRKLEQEALPALSEAILFADRAFTQHLAYALVDWPVFFLVGNATVGYDFAGRTLGQLDSSLTAD